MLALLRARRERPSHRAAPEPRDELAPSQSIKMHLLPPSLADSIRISGHQVRAALHCGISPRLWTGLGQNPLLPHRNIDGCFSSVSGHTLCAGGRFPLYPPPCPCFSLRRAFPPKLRIHLPVERSRGCVGDSADDLLVLEPNAQQTGRGDYDLVQVRVACSRNLRFTGANIIPPPCYGPCSTKATAQPMASR
jgi:hypothetical protein